MKNFHEILLRGNEDRWKKIVGHSFLRLTAERTIPDTTFKTWMQQDYIFVREAIPFIAVLLAKSPLSLRSNFIQILNGLDQELTLFRKHADQHGVSLEHIQPSPTCHAYIQFLMNTAYQRNFEEGFTILYAGEKVYLDSWMAVKKNLKGHSPWQEFIDNWTSEGFQQYVKWLADTLDHLTTGKPQTDLQEMKTLFQTTARYEYLFWDMALKEEKWVI